MKTNKLIGILLFLTLLSCKRASDHSLLEFKDTSENNGLLHLSIYNLGDFKWMNKPRTFTLKNGILNVVADKETDFFNNPEDNEITATAPLLFKEVTGDFVVEALVRPDFSSLWNAAALMIYIDKTHWIKFAFENSDATGQSIVSVVTRGVSDDANGVILTDQDRVWLKIVRKNNIYSMHWSLDGHDFKMARLSAMPSADPVKVGIEVQCPVGESANHQIDYFSLTKTTVKNLRKGE
ncbi:DUF1349 domain-containing protein [Ulvibacterium sp.]|uniref:DUF1349 domain-containing protein n=1 Tax=Ulvibacterium sp. TaxID=2665914 RepID=UPI003BAA7016